MYYPNVVPDSANNTIITRTIAAVADKRHHLGKLRWGFDAKPTGDTYLTVQWTRAGVSTTITIPSSAEGPMADDFSDEVIGDKNTAIVISLSASGAADNLGKLNTSYRTIQ